MSSDRQSLVAYNVSSSNRIVWVNENWWPFARENDGPDLAPEAVIGKCLLDYISDAASRQLYEMLLDRVRSDRREIVLDIRCDSPDKRRFLKVHMQPLDDGAVAFESWTARVEERPAVEAMRRGAAASGLMIRMCSWCKRVEADGRWLEVEEALALLGAMAGDEPPRITHGICPSCYDETWRQAQGE